MGAVVCKLSSCPLILREMLGKFHVLLESFVFLSLAFFSSSDFELVFLTSFFAFRAFPSR